MNTLPMLRVIDGLALSVVGAALLDDRSFATTYRAAWSVDTMMALICAYDRQRKTVDRVALKLLYSC